MYRLMIIDDEEVILHSLSTCIDWSALNIQVCALCHNAVESYEAMEDIYPDLVISDIQMPGYSGLDLIQWASKSNLPTKFILLSGYSKFDYAQQAMRLGVKHYLLKPCNNEQLLSAVQEVCSEIDAERNDTVLLNHKFYHKFQCQTINNILCECVTAPNSFPTMQYAFKYIDFHFEPYYMAILENVPLDTVSDFVKALYRFRDTHFPGTYLHLLYAHNNQIILCRGCAMDTETMTNFLQKQFPDSKIHGEVLPSLIEALEKIFEIAETSVQTHIIYGNDLIPLTNSFQSSLQRKNIAQDIFSADAAKQKQAVDTVLTFIQESTQFDILKTQIVNFIVELDLIAPEFNITESAANLIQKLKQATDRDAIYCDTKMFLRNLAGIRDSSDSICKPFIQKIVDYVNDNLSDPELTLKKIATTYLYMNVNYLGQQFQKQTGMKFSTYLNQKRIEAAKTLLLESGSENIYLVAEKVGCGNNPQYFSQVFKKYTGMSPTVYINKHS